MTTNLYKEIAPDHVLIANSRDVALDLLKGIACLLMIPAHTKSLLPDEKFAAYAGGFAPVFFFSISGITAMMQARKYPPAKMFALYVLLGVLGLTYSGISNPHFLVDLDFDFLQIIAFGSLSAYLVEKYFKPRVWWYAFLALASFAVKFILIDQLNLIGYAGVNGILLPPSLFPIFPWLFLFFMGIFAYKTEHNVNLYALIICAAAYAGLDYLEYPLNPQGKWNMSLGYFLICNILLFTAFYLIKQVPFLRSAKYKNMLVYLGRNSLLFLFLHIGFITLLINFKARYFRDHPAQLWLLLVVCATASTWMLSTLKGLLPATWFSSIYFWIALAAAIFISAEYIQSVNALILINLGIGVLTGLYFPAFMTHFKKS